IVKKEAKENAVYYWIQVPESLQAYFIKKGSVAIDGISLTVFGIEKNFIQLSLIPHTTRETTLGEKGLGYIVNIECDMLLKHVDMRIQIEKQVKRSALDKKILLIIKI